MNGPLTDSTEAVIRLDRFRQKHPGIRIGREFDEWHARLPGGQVHDSDLGQLLDKVEAALGGGPSG